MLDYVSQVILLQFNNVLYFFSLFFLVVINIASNYKCSPHFIANVGLFQPSDFLLQFNKFYK